MKALGGDEFWWENDNADWEPERLEKILRSADLLFTQRSEKISWGNTWCLPGGKMDPGESTYETVCREVEEEIGVEVNDSSEYRLIYQLRDRIAVGHIAAAGFVFMYVGQDVSPHLRVSEDEISEVKWVPFWSTFHPACTRMVAAKSISPFGMILPSCLAMCTGVRHWYLPAVRLDTQEEEEKGEGGVGGEKEGGGGEVLPTIYHESSLFCCCASFPYVYFSDGAPLAQGLTLYMPLELLDQALNKPEAEHMNLRSAYI
jgi:8-oxo-dGTP pyrophosphatase MutT (NUDIX family)